MEAAGKGVGADGGNTTGTNADGVGFEFAFNDAKFSDRILVIEILPDPPKANKSGNRFWGEGCLLHSIFSSNSWLLTICSPSSERLSDGDKDDQNHNEDYEGPSSSSARPTVLRVKTVNINSLLLAANSPFFRKMFSNGMRESEQEKVTIQIYTSEETALMDLLQFIYSNKLSANTPTALLDVLMLADNTSVLDVERELKDVQLVANANSFLAKVSKDITMYQEEAMKLPLDRVKAALSSDVLKIATEDEVYDFVLKWFATHFPNSNDRKEVLRSQLCKCIRFPHLSCQKLREMLTCDDLDPIIASKIVLEALFFKAERLELQRSLIEAKVNNCFDFSYIERAYDLHPVKVIEFDAPLQQCIVHLDLKKEDLSHLTQMNRIRSQDFYVGGNQFHLEVSHNKNESSDWFGMYIFRKVKSKEENPVAVQYEFAARHRTIRKFTIIKKGSCMLLGNDSCGFFNLFDTRWESILSSNFQYFIDNVLYLRADVTVEKVQVAPSGDATPVPRQRLGR